MSKCHHKDKVKVTNLTKKTKKTKCLECKKVIKEGKFE